VTMTHCLDGDGWSYRPTSRTRTLHECIRMLVSMVADDGKPLRAGYKNSSHHKLLSRRGMYFTSL
jgi:hypothetical protein